jgi:large subunit ribosomal protein L6
MTLYYLELVGVGYKAAVSNGYLTLQLGFSHECNVSIPQSVRVVCFKPTLICCVGTHEPTCTQFVQQIRSLRKPDVYKGKGIRYQNERLQQKARVSK